MSRLLCTLCSKVQKKHWPASQWVKQPTIPWSFHYLLLVSGLLLGVPPGVRHEEAHGDVVLSGVSHGLVEVVEVVEDRGDTTTSWRSPDSEHQQRSPPLYIDKII